jgi:hypothetical protein
MKQKRHCALMLSRSLAHMAASINRMKQYENSGLKVDLLYATFQQLLALYYETEAIEAGLESRNMNDFMRQFYGK